MKLLGRMLTSLLFAHLCFGTVAVIEFMNGRIIAAAESRESNGNGTVSSDHVCKIIELNPQTFFLNTGMAGLADSHGKMIWSAGRFSRTAFLATHPAKDRFALVRTVASWAELMQDAYRAGLGHVNDPTGGLGQGVFGEMSINGSQLYRVVLNRSEDPSHPGNTSFSVYHFEELQGTALGDPDAVSLVGEFMANTTERARVANIAFRTRFPEGSPDLDARRIQSAIESAIKWKPNSGTGGDVDVMTLDREGIRWIYQKRECAQPNAKAKQQPKQD